jgi:hypothetical protein
VTCGEIFTIHGVSQECLRVEGIRQIDADPLAIVRENRNPSCIGTDADETQNL